MNPEALELFNSIINKAPSALTTGDIAFLRARRDYLSAEVIERLGLDFKKKKVVTPEVQTTEISVPSEEVENKVENLMPDPTDEVVTTKPVDSPSLESLSYAELKGKAKSLRLKYTAVSTKNLIKNITAKLTEVNGK